MVLFENPVANFKIRELEDESSELEARGSGWDVTRPMRLAKRVNCHRKASEMRKNLSDHQEVNIFNALYIL